MSGATTPSPAQDRTSAAAAGGIRLIRLADALAEHLIRYNRDYNANITMEDMQGKPLWDVIAAEHTD